MHSMTKITRNFRAKMVLLFGLSMFLSGLFTFFIFRLLQSYYHTEVQYGDTAAQFRKLLSRFGDFNVFFSLFIIISFLFFFIFTKRYALYFNEISNGIRHLAHGDFSHKVHIRSNDEFGDIATDINLASEKLQEAIQRGDFSETSKDQLIVNLAHDLRTPLTSVLGYLELMLNDQDLTEEQVKHFLTIAYTKSLRLEKLIDDLFEVSKINYGMLPMQKDKINITNLLLQLKEELYPLLAKKRLIARMDCDPGLQITGDGEQLARVFENVIINAIRYGYDGQYIDVNGRYDEEDVMIEIINYGDSIPADELPHLFDMFYTSDQSRTAKEKSSGIGLFIAKNIIEQHHGTITVASSVIQTVFTIRLPQKHS